MNMKQLGCLFFASIIVCLTILTGCNKEVEVYVTTGDCTEITSTSAVLHGEFLCNDEDKTFECGFAYSKNADMTDYKKVKCSNQTAGLFTGSLMGLDAGSLYYYQAYVENRWGEIKSFTTLSEGGSGSGEEPGQGGSGTLKGHVFVDLGLPSGLKWAACNVGAANPEDNGNYYAWGETAPKTEYSWTTYSLCQGTVQTLTKYNTGDNYGAVDNISVLEACDDAATVNWGEGWRMPTKEELQELATECNWASARVNNKSGWQVTGPNGNTIFLPLCGGAEGTDILTPNIQGVYYTSTMEMNVPYYAWYLYLTFSQCIISDSNRCNGYCVRAVCE